MTQPSHTDLDLAAAPAPRAPVALPRWDRQAWLCIFIASLILIPRSFLIMQKHSECIDTDYHLRHGLAYLQGNREDFAMMSNDAPLGQMILSIPMLLTGSTAASPIDVRRWPTGISIPGDDAPTPERAAVARKLRRGLLYGHAWSPEALLQLLAFWKTLLFVPAMGVIFQWCRAVYGLRAAWLTQALLLFDPNIAAHMPIAALDMLGVEGIVLACFFIWRYFETESLKNLVLMAVTTAAAMLIKHTAVILPGVIGLFALHYWIVRPWRDGVRWTGWRRDLPKRRNALAACLLIGLFSGWAMLLFDYSVPAEQFRGHISFQPTSAIGQTLDNALHRRWPLGTYVGCVVSGFAGNALGQPAVLLGSTSKTGWWYYFPVLMTLKTPIGIWLVLLLAFASLLRNRIRAGEISILIPLLAWLALMMVTRLNYGIRHFLPAYAFLFMWTGRCVIDSGRVITIAAWTGVLAAAAHAASFHPDYLSYVNWPRQKIWMQMTDSNIDWEQSVRQVIPWLDKHPFPGRPIYFVPVAARKMYDGAYYVGDRAHFVEHGKAPPRSGILIISPIWVCGVYDPDLKVKPYEFLQSYDPIDMIGHSLLVYDLDQPARPTERPAP